MKTHRLLYIIFFSLASTMVSCYNKVADEKQEAQHDEHEEENRVELTAAQSRTAGIELGKIEKRQISGTVKVNGVLAVPPQQLVSISVPLGGFVKNTSLLQGSRVKKGQIIATIENLDFPFMTRAIQSLVEPIRWMATGDFKPEWAEGGRPVPRQ